MHSDNFAASGAVHLLEIFGEDVVYAPAGGGDERPISAIVIREPPEVLGVDGSVLFPRMLIKVLSNVDSGILATELNVGGDRIKVAYVKGATQEYHRITHRARKVGAGMLGLVVM